MHCSSSGEKKAKYNFSKKQCCNSSGPSLIEPSTANDGQRPDGPGIAAVAIDVPQEERASPEANRHHIVVLQMNSVAVPNGLALCGWQIP